MTQPELHQLDEQGYVVLERFMPDEFLQALRGGSEELYQQEGENAEANFARSRTRAGWRIWSIRAKYFNNSLPRPAFSNSLAMYWGFDLNSAA